MTTKAQFINALRCGEKPCQDAVKSLLARCPYDDQPQLLAALYELNVSIPTFHAVELWKKEFARKTFDQVQWKAA